MVLFAITAKFNAKTGNKAKVKITGGINLQKLKMVGYAVSLHGVSKETQFDAPTATFGSGFQGHLIPNQLVCNLDVIGTSQIHIATSRENDANGNPVEDTNPCSTGIPLALGDSLNTIQFGLNGLEFDIGKTIHNEIVVEVLEYDSNGKLVPMETDESKVVLVDSTGVVSGTANNNVFGKTALQSVILYFNYDFSSYF